MHPQRRVHVRCLAKLLLLLPAAASAGAMGQSVPERLVVRSHPARCREVPIAVAVDPKWNENIYTLERERDGARFPAWIGPGPGGLGKHFYTVLDELSHDADERFRVSVRLAGDRHGRPVAAIEHGDGAGHAQLRFLLDGERVTELRTDLGHKPILWPLKGPSGAAFTRAYPMEQVAGEDQDHPHQRSMWFTHGAVNGVDFWAEGPQKGRIVLREAQSRSGGACAAVAFLKHDWNGLDSRPICHEKRTIVFYGTREIRVLDFDIELSPAGDAAVVLGDTKEGSFGIRVASSMDVKRHQGGRIVNAENLTDGAAWGKPSAWVDYSGPVDGAIGGIAIINHPTSFRYPTTWHVRDYGLFAANPFGYRDFGMKESGEHRLEPGAVLRLRYRMILHLGRAEEARIAAHHEVYSHPPGIKLE